LIDCKDVVSGLGRNKKKTLYMPFLGGLQDLLLWQG